MAETEGLKPELWLTVGLPRSGKSTWARSTGYPVVSPDAVRQAVHGTDYREDSEPLVWGIVKMMVSALFLAGHPIVILDACNITRKRRDEWAREGWIRCVKLFEVTDEECKARALADGREDLVPVIERMHGQWERPVEISRMDHLPTCHWALVSCAGCERGFRVQPSTSTPYYCAACRPVSLQFGSLRQG